MLTHTVPARRRRASRPAVRTSRGPDRGRQPVAGVVGERSARGRRRRPPGSRARARTPPPGRSASVGPSSLDQRRFHVGAAGDRLGLPLAAGDDARAVARARCDVAAGRRRGARCEISAPSTVSSRAPGRRGRSRGVASPSRSASSSRTGALRRPPGSPHGRSGRRCRRSPSRSPRRPPARSAASASTTCGLLPPSSSDTCLPLDSPA